MWISFDTMNFKYCRDKKVTGAWKPKSNLPVFYSLFKVEAVFFKAYFKGVNSFKV